MTTKDYTYLLNKPYSLNDRQAAELEGILTAFPYLQSARAIYLKGLYNKDSFRYNTELKKTAAYTADRGVLFDFITSEEFRSIDREVLEEQEKTVAEIEVKGDFAAETITETNTITPQEKLEQSIKSLIRDVKSDVEQTAADTPENNVAESTRKALQFDAAETHSFTEWLQINSFKPVERHEEPVQDTKPLDEKLSLIDKFLEASPKIVPVKGDPSPWENLTRTPTETPGLMTETLARVYLEQKKYAKAIQAYEILILKYPEKSVFFAHRISEIKDLQQNNK